MTNSAQGVDYPSQPSLWLASHLRHRLSQTPARTPVWGARDCAPKPPTRPCPAQQLRKEAPQRARCHVGIGSRDVAAARAPRAVPKRAQPRAGGPERKGGMRAFLPLGSGTATACVRDPVPDGGFQSRAQSGQTQPDTLMGCRECRGGEAGERGGSGRMRSVAARRWGSTLLLGVPARSPDRFNPLHHK